MAASKQQNTYNQENGNKERQRKPGLMYNLQLEPYKQTLLLQAVEYNDSKENNIPLARLLHF
jgi:hypothetical protein